MEAPPPVSFGEELKDAFKPVNAWIAGGIAWLDDIQSFYRERATIEKEYGAKLNALSKKYYEKKSKKSASLTVGDTPQMTPGSLESASLTTWTTILTTTEALASEHDALSVALSTQVCDVLKNIGVRYDDFRKRHESLSTKLLSERDGVYGELKKSKAEYDSECKHVEEKRQKIDKSYDSSKGKAERSYQNELTEMSNVKNSYIIQINVANHHKRRYYQEDLPEVLNSLQDLNETRVSKLNTLWTLSSELETNCYQKSISHLETQISEIARNLPQLDSGMFAKHNVCHWNEPPDFVFEASPIWHDNPDMVIDEPAQVYLRNLLQKSKRGMEGLKGEVERRGQEIGKLAENRDKVKLDESMEQKDIDITRALLYSQEDILSHASKLLTYEVQTETILSVVGDVARGTQSHNFKSTSFKIPTNCDLCSERIWGLSSKGFTCTDCGYSCHAKCEMKVPATCPGVLDKAAKKALKEEKRMTMAQNGKNGSETDLSRSNTMSSMSSSYAAGGGGTLGPARMGSKLSKSPSLSGASTKSASSVTTPTAPTAAAKTTAARRVIAPPPDRYVSSPPPPIQKDESPPSTPGGVEQGKMKYAFAGEGEGELKVTEGTTVTIVEDDGSWMTVRLSDGSEGIVPTTYVEKIETPVSSPPRSPSPPPRTAAPPRLTARPLMAAPPPKVGKRGPPPPVKPRGAKKVPKVKALYAYTPTGEDEIEMEAGEEFVVLERDVGGWVKVKAANGEGLVPGTYVEDV
ncbi:hypothetical protein EDC01DRAFT_672062 [Geopyxis carbonaria]|nr:hypothetical protein EDC01DRAFT_672062 [Geopyxis carbonaria]